MHIMLNYNSDIDNMCPKCFDLLWLNSSWLNRQVNANLLCIVRIMILLILNFPMVRSLIL